ncbi:DUF1329 domain-containing protein [Zavarzinia compransoris]|uniref:DUF1329 domain-containing protein n=1 Tax=Zavarzinia compransoris TaxID=1264899 RepID=A0A317E6W8_9PROT|nr:DUF1329 domain-containing protein [Zavarzinia compransoris]PWR22020.1 DUF1329 domain-containing protein [Zavarzinia compransoris]TDP47239.1 uncharacterized protein DUF1329 [Zavarzinia compransoris]
MKLITTLAGLLALGFAAAPAQAKVPEAEAARLGKDLTAVGAVRAGNADGSIPAYDGGIRTPPAGYKPGMHYVHPYAGDQVLHTITGANAAQYAAKLTAGHQAMLRLYPDFKLKVYQSRRSCSLPERVEEASRRNAVTATMTEDQNGLNNAILGVPFPIPQNGVEAIWNHRLRYRGFKFRRYFASAAVNRSGDYALFKAQDEGIMHYSGPGLAEIGDVTDIAQLKNIGISYLNITTAPARLAGSIILVLDTINAKDLPRQAWQYNPGTRRVLRAPELAYDNPLYNTDGLATTDQFDIYNGATDRYSFELKGVKEMYIGYNAYDYMSDQRGYKELLTGGTVNADLGRYELHRVFVVDSTLKEGVRHVYSRRTYYLDEDSWNIAVVEAYDTRGDLWRVQDGPIANYYDIPLCSSAIEATYDIQSGRYVVFGLKNEEKMLNWSVNDVDPSKFTPDAIRRMGSR